MAVYTDLTDGELANLLDAYDLGAPTSFKGIAEGVSNSNFLLETARGRYVLTIFERRFVESELPFFMRVMERLAEQNFPAPMPLHAKDGGFLAHTHGKPACIVTFLNGVSPKSPSVAHCRAIGDALAKLHLALDGLDAERPNGLGPDAWTSLVKPRYALADYLRPGLAGDIDKDFEALTHAWPASLKRGVIHADLFPDNALFVGNDLGGVIDFYFACNDFLAYDLAVSLNAWCFDENGRAYNLDKGEAMMAAYERVRPLSPEGREALPILCRGAAMRFFATRLADWADTPPGALVRPHDPLEYANRLMFHRQARSVKDYGG